MIVSTYQSWTLSLMSDAGNEASATIVRRRRSWTRDEKRRIIAESLQDGASAAEVARRHDLNANLLFTWRRQLDTEALEPTDLPRILPVMITPEDAAEPPPHGTIGQMEIVLSSSERIIVWSDVETAALTRVLKALARR